MEKPQAQLQHVPRAEGVPIKARLSLSEVHDQDDKTVPAAKLDGSLAEAGPKSHGRERSARRGRSRQDVSKVDDNRGSVAVWRSRRHDGVQSQARF